MTSSVKLKNKRVVPPIGWVYYVPETKHTIRRATFIDLVQHVKRHFKANELEIPDDIENRIEKFICDRIPLSMTTSTANRNEFSKLRMTVGAVQRATSAALHAWRDEKRRSVSSKEAEERAQICVDCPENTRNTACLSCRGLNNWVKGWQSVSTTKDNQLFICGVSAIMNIAHVHLTEPALRKCISSTLIPKHPETCWKRKTLEN